MSGKTDEVKGRIKEAAGALIGNDKLRDEGKTDQAVGKVKQVAEKAVEKVKEAVKKVTWLSCSSVRTGRGMFSVRSRPVFRPKEVRSWDFLN